MTVFWLCPSIVRRRTARPTDKPPATQPQGDAGLRRAAARRRQAADLPGGRAHPLRWACGRRRPAGARHPHAAAVLERPDRADRSADRPPHALQGYRANAREHREAFPAHGKLRRAPGTTRLDCLSSNGRLDTYKRVLARLAELGEEELRPKPLLTGRDLIELGYQPGPSFAKMLAAVEDAQLEARVQSKEAALALVRAQFGEPGN